MKYVSLHHHSTFSFLDGFGLPEAHVRRAVELGMPALALTDHGNISGHVKLEQAANAAGIKPIFGCELYTGGVDEANRKQRKNHLTVLAQDEEGYRNLLRVVSEGWSKGFYYEPTVSGPMLKERSSGLVILSGCLGSLLATSLVGGKNIAEDDASYRRARRVAASFKHHFGDAYYLEVQAFPELEKSRQVNQAYAQISEELGIPLVASGDVHYTKPSESEMQQILHNVRGGGKQTLEEQARSWGYDVPLCPPLSDAVMLKRLMGTGLTRRQALSSISNAGEIAERCNVILPKLDRLRYPIPANEDPLVVWRKWLQEGWNYRGIPAMPPKRIKEYKARLKYEMSIIEEKDFVDYFLVVSDVVKFAKDSGIPVGPARGSAAASLVCFLLRITEVDPLQYPSLIFERFIDLTRQDLPDIDLDFDSERRREIRDYLVSKYGSDRVSNLGTFTSYKPKLALDDVARVHRIPKYEVEQVKDLILERSSGDLRASNSIEDTIANFEVAAGVFERHPELAKAMDLEGQYKGMGVHAAGLVVSNGPITDVCGVYARKVRDIYTEVVSVDKYDAEYLELLKIDLLGLNTMTMISHALKNIGMTLEELYAVPLDDPNTLRGFQENDVAGIFQFDGRAMRSVCGEVRPDSFLEVADVNALARPGPLHSGATAEYIDAKRGKAPVSLHPLLDSITTDTYGQIVYQEQILRVVREIGGFDWTHAAYIRKIISRKIGEQEFNRQWGRFWEGAEANGLDESTARTIWDACITAGAYAFNAAHSVSYGMLAWWTMWLKRNHPQEFYCAALNKYPKKQLGLLRDADRHDLEIWAPDVALSDTGWTPAGIGGNALRAGLTQIHGIADKTAERIKEWRSSKGTFDIGGWYDLQEIKGIGPKTIEKIIDFVSEDDPFQVHFLSDNLKRIKKEIRNGTLGRLPDPTHTSLQVPYSRGEDTEVVWLGQIDHRNLRELFELHYSRTGEQLDPATVKDPHLNEWVVLLGRDDQEELTVTVNRWKYPKFKAALWGIKLGYDFVLVRGVKRGFQARRAIYVNDLWVISPDDDTEEEEDAEG